MSTPSPVRLVAGREISDRLHGKLVYFALFKEHIGLYPTASGIKAFQQQLSAYEGSKGAIRFPLDRPLPHILITKIVRYRLNENLQKADLKSIRGKTPPRQTPQRKST